MDTYDYTIKKHKDYLYNYITWQLLIGTYEMAGVIFRLFKESILNDIDGVEVTRNGLQVTISNSNGQDYSEYIEKLVKQRMENQHLLERIYQNQFLENYTK